MEYMAIHHRRYKLPVYPVVINLTGGGKQNTQYMLECLDLTVVSFNYRQINLQDIAGREIALPGTDGLATAGASYAAGRTTRNGAGKVREAAGKRSAWQ